MGASAIRKLDRNALYIRPILNFAGCSTDKERKIPEDRDKKAANLSATTRESIKLR